jgi:hypothetical protein
MRANDLFPTVVSRTRRGEVEECETRICDVFLEFSSIDVGGNTELVDFTAVTFDSVRTVLLVVVVAFIRA